MFTDAHYICSVTTVYTVSPKINYFSSNLTDDNPPVGKINYLHQIICHNFVKFQPTLQAFVY